MEIQLNDYHKEDGFHGLLARASAFAGGVLSSIQALAGTTARKGVQIAKLNIKHYIYE